MAEACECGAPSDCLPVWHAALAAEQADRVMYAWHNPLVCAFLLQHRSHRRDRYADGQFRWLQHYVHEGIDAVNALARRTAARNRRPRPSAPAELERYHPLPESPQPARFEVSVHHLERPGGCMAQGAAAYGRRMTELARATVDAWLRVA